ncbi:hypothetical protein [Luteolibacter marinus]|uniref:hypothetical protein n=1 Tax=Luteolibacter marinus TaxID=2776705 RepID=UPI001867E4C3|nr:hypothetical protein [Luteolibacter marinus]
MQIEPSRYAGEDLPTYIQMLASRLAVRSRQTDPFGRYQDPEFKAPEPKILAAAPTQRFQPEPPTPFINIVGALPVNMVTAEKQQFLIGDRVFSTNQTFKISLPNGKQVTVQVVSISATQILFRNVETGETAPLTLNMMPAGMQRGTDGISAPGVTQGGSNAPIEIQPVTPLSNNR